MKKGICLMSQTSRRHDDRCPCAAGSSGAAATAAGPGAAAGGQALALTDAAQASATWVECAHCGRKHPGECWYKHIPKKQVQAHMQAKKGAAKATAAWKAAVTQMGIFGSRPAPATPGIPPRAGPGG